MIDAMNATYTPQDLQTIAAGIKLAAAEKLTIGQRMLIGKLDAESMAKEFLDFIGRSRHDFSSEAALFRGLSPKFMKLVELGIIEIKLSR